MLRKQEMEEGQSTASKFTPWQSDGFIRKETSALTLVIELEKGK